MKKRRVIVVDLDDTIAKKTTRHKFDWTKLHEDSGITGVLDIIHAYTYASNTKIVVLTARNEGYPNPLKKQPEITNYKTIGREMTEIWVAEWLGDSNVVDRIIMKPCDSFEKSSTFKVREIQKLLEEGLDIEFILDDHQDVIEAVKETFPQITLLKVANYK